MRAVVLGVFIGGRSAGAHAVRIVSRGEFLFLDAFEVIRRGARGYNASHSLVSRCRSHESCHPTAGVAKNSDPSRIDVSLIAQAWPCCGSNRATLSLPHHVLPGFTRSV